MNRTADATTLPARMSLLRFRERMDENTSFARLMRRNVTATLFTTQQFAACNARHDVALTKAPFRSRERAADCNGLAG